MKKTVVTALIVLINVFYGIAGHTSALFSNQVDNDDRDISPYIYKVYDFMPAPGQFVNTLPKYLQGDTRETMIIKAETAIANDNRGTISLGGYGGYVVFGFDHEVKNIPGKYDFKILGNAFFSNSNTNPEAPREGGNCEPGIVMVSYDANNNGIPDDEWYELAGSEYHRPETIHNYEITYYKPDENKDKTPDPNYPFLNDTTYIRWTSNQGDYGYVSRNTYHSQPYYPQWITAETIVFEGAKLANNYIDESGTGSYYVQYAYDWGYADNYPNSHKRSGFNIEWAVDSDGNCMNLPGIHFVKVYTGVNQYCGWLGETSTEILGAEDLHLTDGDEDVEDGATAIEPLQAEKSIVLLQNPVTQQLFIASAEQQKADVYNLMGNKVMTFQLQSGTNHIACNLLQGLYVLVVDNQTIKFIKKK
ncbi:MAG: T9SS type A sorting domain-containing protein [Prevotellaceae bacterium]|nr:T9SS type A sorting domain-containing protein [Prevotellaceae bacterium]